MNYDDVILDMRVNTTDGVGTVKRKDIFTTSLHGSPPVGETILVLVDGHAICTNFKPKDITKGVENV